MNEYELYVVKEYKFDNPLNTKIVSITDSCYRDCHKNYFRTFEYKCEYDIKLTKTTNNEIIDITISEKSMRLFELNKKLTGARQNGFIFIQINKVPIKSYSPQRYVNIGYYLKFQIPICLRLFFRKLSQNPEYVKTHCKDLNNFF